jgi:hypothetical protein
LRGFSSTVLSHHQWRDITNYHSSQQSERVDGETSKGARWTTADNWHGRACCSPLSQGIPRRHRCVAWKAGLAGVSTTSHDPACRNRPGETAMSTPTSICLRRVVVARLNAHMLGNSAKPTSALRNIAQGSTLPRRFNSPAGCAE